MQMQTTALLEGVQDWYIIFGLISNSTKGI